MGGGAACRTPHLRVASPRRAHPWWGAVPRLCWGSSGAEMTSLPPAGTASRPRSATGFLESPGHVAHRLTDTWWVWGPEDSEVGCGHRTPGKNLYFGGRLCLLQAPSWLHRDGHCIFLKHCSHSSLHGVGHSEDRVSSGNVVASRKLLLASAPLSPSVN